MNKLELLFDGTSIINIPFYIKLLKRYIKSTVLFSLAILLVCTLVYFYQEDFYWTSISFSDATEDKSDSNLKAVSFLLGDKKGGLRVSDILNLRSSIDFNRKIAKNLIDSENFSKLRFDLNFIGIKALLGADFEKKCTLDKDCIIEEVSKRIPKFYQISDKDRSGVNFIVEVKALDEVTSRLILKAVSNSILESRKDAVRFNLKDQQKSSTTILIEKKKEVDVANFLTLQEEKDRKENELKEIQSKIDHQINVITSVQDNLASAESSFHRAQKIANKKIDYDDLDLELRKKELRDRIEKLNSDIAALEDVTTEHSLKDKEIIQQLKKESIEAKKKLKKLGESTGTQVSLNQFVKQNDEKLHSKELDYRVLKDQLESAKQTYDEMIIKKKDILGEKIKTEQTIESMKPSIEYIKNLELKIEQLKLMETSITADVRFDNYAANPEPVKKMGFIILLVSCMFIELMFGVLYLSFRYYFDDKIYDQDDLLQLSKNLKIIGNGPKYD